MQMPWKHITSPPTFVKGGEGRGTGTATATAAITGEHLHHTHYISLACVAVPAQPSLVVPCREYESPAGARVRHSAVWPCLEWQAEEAK